MTTGRVDLLDVDGTVLVESVPRGSRRGFVEPRARFSMGMGSVTLPNDDPTRALAVDVGYRLWRWWVAGQPVAVTVITKHPYARIGPSDGLVTVLDGPGGLGMLGSNDCPGVVVEGWRSTRRRVFGWVEPGDRYPTVGWTPGDSFGAYRDDSDGSFIYSAPAPDEWPYGNCDRVTAVDNFSDGAGAIWHDPLATFFHRYQTPHLGSDRQIRVFVAGSNHVWFWWDGKQEMSGSAAGKNHTYTMKSFDFAADGPAQLAIRLLNGRTQGGAGVSNVAWCMYVGYVIDEDGTFDPANPIFWSSTGKGLWTDVRPEAITAGYIIPELLAEGQGRGCLPGVSCAADETLDSNAQPWARHREVVTFDDATPLTEVVEQCIDFFGVDARIKVGAEGLGQKATLELVLTDDAATVTGVELTDSTTAASAGVAEANVIATAPGANAIRAATGGGVVWETSPGRITQDTVRREAPAEFGRYEDILEVRPAIQSMLNRLRGTILQTVQSAGPAGQRPWTDFSVGDVVKARVETAGAFVAHTVEAISVDFADGEPEGIDPEVEFMIDLERRL